MKTFKKLTLSFMLAIFGLINLSMFSVVHATDNVYNEVLNQTTSKLPNVIK